MVAWAHSRNTGGERHDLIEHLRGVATRAGEFARPFGGEALAHVAGLYHDLGKFHPAWQAYLAWCDEHPGERRRGGDHKGAGVSHVSAFNGALRLVIAAHHGGLRSFTEVQTWLAEDGVRSRVGEALRLAADALPELSEAPAAMALPGFAQSDAVAAEFFVRMLFSCLVDADFLDTEAHFNKAASSRRASAFDASMLSAQLRDHQASLARGRDDELTQLRARIADACSEAGGMPPGIYRMTVPTGGGKTLAGMGFALRHAAAYGKRRVIVAIPYTSIVDQTASAYRGVFGLDDMVLEHSSAAMPDERDDDDPATESHIWERLAAENWDAPIVVTTTVQLFQSLLGRRVSGSRKLHNLANSVLILDEVQMLPVHHLDALLDVLERLAADYGVTVLLSTATQPRFTHERFQVLPEIAPDPPALFEKLQRVRYAFPSGTWAWVDAAAALRAEPQAMMVLNTKKDARAVLDALGDPDALHLSTLLCGAHRHAVLNEVKSRLGSGRRCRLVATQVVEAGVDISFPVVFRAMGPLDRILQSAGRCNREGLLDGLGRVVVFRPAQGHLPPGAYKVATEHTATVLAEGGWPDRIHDPGEIGPWFEWLYRTMPTDRNGVQKLRAAFDYRGVAHAFRMIEDDAEDVVVPWGDEAQRATVQDAVDGLRKKRGSARMHMRRLQPYTVPLRRADVNRAAARGFLSPVIEGVSMLDAPERYGRHGLDVEGADRELLLFGRAPGEAQ